MEKITSKRKPRVRMRKIKTKMQIAMRKIMHPPAIIAIAILIIIRALLIGVVNIFDKIGEYLFRLFYKQKGKKKISFKDILNGIGSVL